MVKVRGISIYGWLNGWRVLQEQYLREIEI
jgi:hypothetical protein